MGNDRGRWLTSPQNKHTTTYTDTQVKANSSSVSTKKPRRFAWRPVCRSPHTSLKNLLVMPEWGGAGCVRVWGLLLSKTQQFRVDEPQPHSQTAVFCSHTRDTHTHRHHSPTPLVPSASQEADQATFLLVFHHLNSQPNKAGSSVRTAIHLKCIFSYRSYIN